MERGSAAGGRQTSVSRAWSRQRGDACGYGYRREGLCEEGSPGGSETVVRVVAQAERTQVKLRTHCEYSMRSSQIVIVVFQVR